MVRLRLGVELGGRLGLVEGPGCQKCIRARVRASVRVRLNSFGFGARVGFRTDYGLRIQGPCWGLDWCLDFVWKVEDTTTVQDSG